MSAFDKATCLPTGLGWRAVILSRTAGAAAPQERQSEGAHMGCMVSLPKYLNAPSGDAANWEELRLFQLHFRLVVWSGFCL
jgi:hypothetical protein